MIALKNGTVPLGLPVEVKPGGAVEIGGNALSPEDYAEMRAYVESHPHFVDASVKSRLSEASEAEEPKGNEPEADAPERKGKK